MTRQNDAPEDPLKSLRTSSALRGEDPGLRRKTGRLRLMAGAAAADMDFSCPHGSISFGGIATGGWSLERATVPDGSRMCRYEVSGSKMPL